MKGKGNARLIRGGRLRVRLAKLNGGAIESTYLLRQLEPVVCVGKLNLYIRMLVRNCELKIQLIVSQ